ncbi:MAG TPA: hypothetical protein VJT73_03450 [Polyangiaceae bacterium]|nr:hypothetical protein [Polyangiaceae bacterium]
MGAASLTRRGMLRALPLVLLLALSPSVASALDKQGSAHGGSVDASATGFKVSGSGTFGVSLYNPTYAARPDNTGLALFRYAAHADVDLIGPKLSIPIDFNVFTDRQRKGLAIFAPTEFDVIVGLTTTWPAGPGALELGARVEHDRPVDQGSFTQTYVDARARYLYSLASQSQWLTQNGADISGAATLGVFAVNPTYAARPDNTGLALLRYGLRGELSLWEDLLSFGLDGVMFTDRQVNAFRPSELDFTPEVILHVGRWEAHLAYERDMPVDRGGLVQSFVYALAVCSFDSSSEAPPPLQQRESVVSP